MTKGVVPKEVPESVMHIANSARFTQMVNLIKENQLITAFVLFFLWQTGAFLSAYSYVKGGMC